MPIEIIDCEQNTEAWYQARCGIVTASCVGDVLAHGVGGAPSKMRAGYMAKLVGEIIGGQPADSYVSPAMERGHLMEEQARMNYAFMTDAQPEVVGFIRNGARGASPDALIGPDGILEIKTAEPKVLIPIMKAGRFPPEHVTQCQALLWICEREWVDLAIFWPTFPLFYKRAHRDEVLIARMSREVAKFEAELAADVAFVRNYRATP